MSIRLYIGNLPEDVTREDLEAVFNPEGGEVLFSAKLITDRKTGKCRGFGFVTFACRETGLRVIKQSQSEQLMIKGKQIIIKEADSKEGTREKLEKE